MHKGIIVFSSFSGLWAPTSQRVRVWWQGLNHQRQSLFTNLVPLATISMFLLVIVLAFAYLQGEESDLQQEQLQRDQDYFNQRITLRLQAINSKIETLLLTSKSNGTTSIATSQEVYSLFEYFPEVLSLTWVNSNALIERHQSAQLLSNSPLRGIGQKITDPKIQTALKAAASIVYPVYSEISMYPDRPDTFALVYPLIAYNNTVKGYNGALILELNVDTLLNYSLPNEFSARYAIASFITQTDGTAYLRSGSVLLPRKPWLGLLPRLSSSAQLQWTIPTLGNGLQLRFHAYRSNADFVGRSLFWIAGGLALFTIFVLFLNWRYMRKRNAAQEALLAEANFRRAMGNSMLIGVRVLDMQAQVTYVNPAFCHMTGFSEAQLLYTKPPFPYWPDQNIQSLQETLEAELQNVENTQGRQVQLMRKNGNFFDARIYTSPLVDARGEQTGWITSMTDITEPTRIRQQLSESFERFTKVLEALDASVSVALLGNTKLVFTNKLYRDWFGESETGHLQLLHEAGLTDTNDAPSTDAVDLTPVHTHKPSKEKKPEQEENAEIYITKLNRWLEVRSRYLNWVDGQAAQMVIASDITPRRQAEILEAEQAQRAEKISRLVAMGEMASGVAHELNQPLTAINNYCTGILQRMHQGWNNTTELQATLEKTANQAQRAGNIIQRIREFVKRNEPKRITVAIDTIVNNSLELAEIELRKRGVRLHYTADPDLPALTVDPILIEQVLINLLKNAAESIEQAACPPNQRIVQLRVQKRLLPEAKQQRLAVRFCVQDNGKGIAPEAMERLYETFFSTKDDGMGIGLSLCRSIIEAHEGYIQARNLYNGSCIKGCQFSFWLPVLKK